MTAYWSGADEMRAYAWSRVQDAERALVAHRRDGAGCCVCCGRPAPCDVMLQARRLGEHYRGWLAGARTWVDADGAGARLRPYVLVGIGDDGHTA
jgi:hypothetical protein